MQPRAPRVLAQGVDGGTAPGAGTRECGEDLIRSTATRVTTMVEASIVRLAASGLAFAESPVRVNGEKETTWILWTTVAAVAGPLHLPQ